MLLSSAFVSSLERQQRQPDEECGVVRGGSSRERERLSQAGRQAAGRQQRLGSHTERQAQRERGRQPAGEFTIKASEPKQKLSARAHRHAQQ